MTAELKEIFEQFTHEGTYLSGEIFGNGHIHDTYRIKTAESDKDDYILQKLNHNIFKDIPLLQKNIERVTVHLNSKLTKIVGANAKRECLTLIAAKNGKSWINDTDGNFWRLYIFITNHRSYGIVDSINKAFEGGRTVGRFQAMLADMQGEPLAETIPKFHDVENRLNIFLDTIQRNPKGRVSVAEAEIKEYLDRSEEMKIIMQLGREGKIPLRITHNDTKFNNILLDENDKALCITDLDTVMPGYVHYDFGDAIRTAANTAAEDEKDLSKIEMNIELFEAYANGYLSEMKNTLNEVEIEYLAFAPKLITYIIGLRFLTDYIDGDNYFKIYHEHHNLQRAKAQLKLVKSMERQYGEMKKIIKKLVKQ